MAADGYKKIEKKSLQGRSSIPVSTTALFSTKQADFVKSHSVKCEYI